MRIYGPNRMTGVGGSSTARRGDGPSSSFLPHEAEPPARTPTASAPMALAGLDALIALQAIDADAPRKKRKAVRKGHDILDLLDEIKVGLLSGGLSAEAIERVIWQLDGIEESGDPALDDLIADIALRAEVELAKLGRYRN